VRVDRPEPRNRQGRSPPARPAHRGLPCCGRKKTAGRRSSALVFRAVKPAPPLSRRRAQYPPQAGKRQGATRSVGLQVSPAVRGLAVPRMRSRGRGRILGGGGMMQVSPPPAESGPPCGLLEAGGTCPLPASRSPILARHDGRPGRSARAGAARGGFDLARRGGVPRRRHARHGAFRAGLVQSGGETAGRRACLPNRRPAVTDFRRADGRRERDRPAQPDTAERGCFLNFPLRGQKPPRIGRRFPLHRITTHKVCYVKLRFPLSHKKRKILYDFNGLAMMQQALAHARGVIR